MPVRVESYAKFITQNLRQLAKVLGRRHPDFIKLLGILYLIKSAPGETKGKERYDQIAFVKGLLWELYTQNPDVKEFIDGNVKFFNGEPGNPESFNPLDSLLNEQFYRLAFWKVGAEEINYRRFFTVNELISVKIQEIKIFHKAHDLVSQLIEQGKVTGLRIDHIDGLYDPTEYLKRLQDKVGDAYITVEKILELKEKLPECWPIEGTSGYDFLNYVNGIFCKRESEKELTDLYVKFTGINSSYEEQFIEKKNIIIEKNLAGDVDNLTQILRKIAGQSRRYSDFTINGLKRALAEVLRVFPVYRTYVNGDGLIEQDRGYIQEAIAHARERIPLLVNELNYIEKLLLLQWEEFLTEEQKADRLHFVMRMQQLSGALMAKGIEDTLFYVYNRHLALNEVGGHPGKFGINIEYLPEFNQQQNVAWPHKMNATATHDTKRGEDVRARLQVLSEIPEEWEKQVKTCSEINLPKKSYVRGKAVPVPNDEYFFYQSLLGAYPFDESENESFLGRVKDYILKSLREAKLHKAWLRHDRDYEAGFLAFVEKVLHTSDSNQFMKQFLPFPKWIATYGIYNSLSQTLLKYTSPGVPDTYQGTELWDLSMVDPDNRRPVNYERRIGYLKEIKEKAQIDIHQLLDELLSNKEDGRIKLFLTHKVLPARKENVAVFEQGDALARSFGDKMAISVAPSFFTTLVKPGELPLGEQVWADTKLLMPLGVESTGRDGITNQTISGGNRVALAQILQHFPVALLISQA
ncbi:malto-oligosyltrehalose synthase [Microseira wollei NIES-4236]|uniref:Malto-oligosyltrehalose synthase n=1 Tax=Microseira wollei NIES-4236 TaxID=2530354 RepID=A0AAV3WJN8_9CYAN|nr:malto-oligosyltrehalose synthase [Microseira wollei NIES-4236]